MVIHVLRRLPVGIVQTGVRRERDACGATNVPADRYWGACTQRTLTTLPASDDRIPDRLYRCYGYAKQAAAMANESSGLLQPWKREAIWTAAGELIEGMLADHFPLAVWQSGSGLATDVNVNEVLANRSIQLLGGVVGSRSPIHPAKDVNLAQSAAATFTTVMHIAIVMEIEQLLIPKATALARVIERASRAVALGGWSRSGYAYRLRQSLRRVDEAQGDMHEVVVGEPPEAVPKERARQHLEDIACGITATTGRPFILAGHRGPEACSLDPVVAAMAAVRGLAVTLLGIIEDVGLASGASVPLPPSIPALPVTFSAGLEASAMSCMAVITEDARVIAGSGRHGPAPMMRPLVVRSVLNAIRVLGDACEATRAVFVGQTRSVRGHIGEMQ